MVLGSHSLLLCCQEHGIFLDKGGKVLSSPHHQLPSSPLDTKAQRLEDSCRRFPATLRAGKNRVFPLDYCPSTTRVVGSGRSHETGFIKGSPYCVYQEATTDLYLEEGPGLLFIHVSIIEIIISIREIL